MGRFFFQYKQLDRLLQSIEVEQNFTYFDVEANGGPQSVARKLRQYWKIPSGPIENLTEVLENAGIFILHISMPVNQIDGFYYVADGKIPLIVLNKNMPPCRMRFTLAHELGHLIMHKINTSDSDKQADQFASEFLAPEDEVQFPSGRLTVTHLADLKMYWRVSMQMLLYKAKEVGIITSRQSSYLWSQFMKLGYRLREPIELDPPFEKPFLINELFRMHLEELEYSLEDLANLFVVNHHDFQEWWESHLPKTSKQTPLKLVKGGLYYGSNRERR